MKKIAEQKKSLRELCSRKRRYLEENNRKHFDEIIFNKIEKLPELKQAKTILVYISTKHETSTIKFIKKYIKEKQIVVPKTHLRFQTLTLHKIKSFDELYKGRYNILEPYPQAEIIKPEKVDLAFIPGIAFDKKGHRIGYGKAYYDKLLLSLKCPKIGLAYEIQIVENVPAEKHDKKIDKLITEKKIYNFTT